MKPLKEKISITVDSDILEIIRKKADEDERSLSQYINLILKQHLNNIENWKNGLLKENSPTTVHYCLKILHPKLVGTRVLDGS